MLTYKLNMLLYRTFWIRRRDSCQAVPACSLCAYSCSAGFIHHQTRERNLLSHPGLPASAQDAPQGATVGCGDSRGSPLPPAAAAPKCCSPRANQWRHPSERWSAPGDARQAETYRIPPCARAPCIRWPSRWQSRLCIIHVFIITLLLPIITIITHY